jgi:hypothetical protein
MTSIGRPTDGQVDSAMGGPLAEDTLGDGRQDLNRRYGDLTSLADSRPDSGEDNLPPMCGVSSGEADFLKCFHSAISAQSGEGKDKDSDIRDTHRDGAEMIAIAQQPNWMFLTSPSPAASPVTETRALASEVKVNLITEAIERAIRAEMAPQPGQPLSLHVNLGGDAFGLAGLNVTVTPLNIEVVLLRPDPVIQEELAGAAQALADRLMARFSKRTVRVLQSHTRAGSTPRSPLREISNSLSLPAEA